MRGGILHGKAGTERDRLGGSISFGGGELFLPVSKAYAGPVSGGSPEVER